MIQQHGPLSGALNMGGAVGGDLSLNMGGMSNNGGPESGIVGGGSELLPNAIATPPNSLLDFLDYETDNLPDVPGAEQWPGTEKGMGLWLTL